MKILHVVSEFPCLSETFILDQITGLLDLGHDVAILADRPQEATASRTDHPDIERHGLLARTTYRPRLAKSRLKRRFQTAALFARAALLRPSMISSFPGLLAHRTHAGASTLIATAFGLESAGDCDVIHCHYGPNGLNVALLKSLGLVDVPTITSFYGFDVSEFVARAGPSIYEPLFAGSDLLLPLSRVMEDELETLGADPLRLRIHRLGIDCEAFAFAPRMRPEAGPVRLISVARLVEKKGLADAIRAVARLRAEGREVVYEIVGDGPLRAELEGLAGSLGIGDSVRFLGAMSRPDVRSKLGRSHILLAPSVAAKSGDREGTPVALIEAMASGLPVVSTRHSAIPEMIDDGTSGLLAPENDCDALAGCIARLLDDGNLWDTLTGAARAQVEADFNIRTQVAKLQGIYRELVSSATTTPGSSGALKTPTKGAN